MIWTQSLTLYNNKYMRDRWDFYFCLHIFYSLVIRLSRVCCWPLNFQSTGKILYQYVHKCSCNEVFRRNVHFLSRKLFKTHWKIFQIQMQLSKSSTQKSSQFHLKWNIWSIVFPVLIFLNNFLSLFFLHYFSSVLWFICYLLLFWSTLHIKNNGIDK